MTGCAAKLHVVVNPDGSGKMVCSGRFPAVSEVIDGFHPGTVTPADCEAQYVMVLRQFLGHVNGIEAWKEATYEEHDHLSFVTITGYFPDINKVNLDTAKQGGPPTSWRDQDGRWHLLMSGPKEAASSNVATDRPTTEDEDEQIKMLTRQMQDGLQTWTPKLSLVVAWLTPEMGCRSEVEVGGVIQKAVGLQTEGKSTAWQFDSFQQEWKFLERMSAIKEMPEALAREMVLQRAGSANVDWSQAGPKAYAIYKRFAAREIQKPASELIIDPNGPVFDYAKEVADAKANPGPLMLRVRNPLQSAVAKTPMIGARFAGAGGGDPPLVASVLPNSPAAAAHLQAGDRIEQFNGTAVVSAKQFIDLVRSMKVGDKIRLNVQRGAEHIDLEVTLAAAKDVSP